MSDDTCIDLSERTQKDEREIAGLQVNTAEVVEMRLPESVNERGFTLLEIVVALAILGLSLTVTMQLISGAFNNISRINHYFVASNHAENVMNELLVSPEISGPMQNTGVFNDGYRWSAEIVECIVPPEVEDMEQPVELPYQVLEVRVAIEWDQRDRQHQYTLRSLRMVNTQAGNLPGLSNPRLSESRQTIGASTSVSESANQERLRPRRGGARRGGGRSRPRP